MEVKVVRMRKNGVAISGRALGQEFPAAGTLVILDVTDQGLRRQVKVARLLQGDASRYELVDPHIVWAADDSGFLYGLANEQRRTGVSRWRVLSGKRTRKAPPSITRNHGYACSIYQGSSTWDRGGRRAWSAERFRARCFCAVPLAGRYRQVH